MTPDPAAIIRALLAIVEQGATNSSDPEGSHFMGWNLAADHRGVCLGHFRDLMDGDIVPDGSGFRMVNRTRVGECANRCQEWRAARDAARAYLEAVEPRQLRLVREAV